MLDDGLTCDEDLVRRLPLPLAQLYRRGHNAKSALERHQAAYYMWEASLKLLGSVAIVEYSARAQPDDPLLGRLQNLARPSTGHWWEMLRSLTPALADGGDAHFATIRDLLLGRSRDDLPRAAGIDAALCEALDNNRGARATVRLSELFDRLVQYRNRVIGHGAAGQHADDFYDRMGRALLSGVPEILSRVDTLAGRKLLYVRELSGQSNGDWSVEQFDLTGETARRVRSLDFPAAEVARLPRPQRVYLSQRDPSESAPGQLPSGSPGLSKDLRSAAGLRQLHPFIVYDIESSESLFFSARRGGDRMEYLCYSSGRVLERREPADEQQPVLARLLSGDKEGVADAAGGKGGVNPGKGAPSDEVNATPAERIASGDQGLVRLGEFELLSELGRGGMGIVYRAWQPSLDRQVALKSMLRSGDPKAEARFGQEIKALGRVDHPHLVKIFTSGAEADRWFYSMELIEGATLAAVCENLVASSSRAEGLKWTTWRRALTTVSDESRRGEKAIGNSAVPDSNAKAPESHIPPAPNRRPAADSALSSDSTDNCVRHWVELARQVAEAAQALHEAGVIHRDIKPDNVMLTANGTEAVLMDLGLAQLDEDPRKRLTRTRQFVSTLRYASPEQVLAVGRVDARSDIYSLGATLWELLTLRPIFGATDETPTPRLMQQIQFDDPEPVRRYNSAVPKDLEAVVLKCLEKDPRRRYASALELANDLNRWLQGRPVTAQGRTATYVMRKFLDRHRVGVIATLAAMFILGVGYLGLCDAGVRLPGGETLRRRLDQLGLSMFRPIHGDEKIRSAAANLRQELYRALIQAPTKDGWLSKNLDPKQTPAGIGPDVWSHCQALTALLKAPECGASDYAELRHRLALPFDSHLMVQDRQGVKYGWAVRPPKESYTVAQPALWTAAALAIGLGKSGFFTGDERQQAEQRLAQTQEILKIYHPLATGGWNMYPLQADPGQHNPYVTALGLLALLEARRSNLPWEGSAERRDALLSATAKWLIDAYDSTDDPPGWREAALDNSRPLDGLTLQIYALLLRAEAEAGVQLPATLANNIPRHLARCIDRGSDYPDSVGKFVIDFTAPDGKNVVGSEPIKFLWYPWAIDCATRWLRRPAAESSQNTTPDDRIAVRRALGHLVVGLGSERAANAPTEWTFVVSETLYCLSSAAIANGEK